MNRSLNKGQSRLGDMDLSIKLTKDEIRQFLNRDEMVGLPEFPHFSQIFIN